MGDFHFYQNIIIQFVGPRCRAVWECLHGPCVRRVGNPPSWSVNQKLKLLVVLLVLQRSLQCVLNWGTKTKINEFNIALRCVPVGRIYPCWMTPTHSALIRSAVASLTQQVKHARCVSPAAPSQTEWTHDALHSTVVSVIQAATLITSLCEWPLQRDVGLRFWEFPSSSEPEPTALIKMDGKTRRIQH